MSPPFNLPSGTTLSDIKGDDSEERERKYESYVEEEDHKGDIERETF